MGRLTTEPTVETVGCAMAGPAGYPQVVDAPLGKIPTVNREKREVAEAERCDHPASFEMAAAIQTTCVEWRKGDDGSYRFATQLPYLHWFPPGGMTEDVWCPRCRNLLPTEHFWAHAALAVDENGVVLPVSRGCLPALHLWNRYRSRRDYDGAVGKALRARKEVEEFLGGEVSWPPLSPFRPEVSARTDYPQVPSDHLEELIKYVPCPSWKDTGRLVEVTGLSLHQLDAWYAKYRQTTGRLLWKRDGGGSKLCPYQPGEDRDGREHDGFFAHDCKGCVEYYRQVK